MYTHCPECNTAFRITTVQLRMGQGQAICAKCGTLFDAISSLSDVAFEDHYSDFRRLPTLPMEQALAPPVARPEGTVGSPEAGNGNRFLRSRKALGRSGWRLGTALSCLLLVMQWSVFEAGRLTQNPDLRPWLEEFCIWTGCELPSYRDPAAIEVLEKNLDAIGPDALELRVVMINGSRFDQAFPRLKLELIRLNGEPLARRIFFPEDYFRDTVHHPVRLAAGQTFEIRLTMIKPKMEIGGYQFSLI